MGNLGRTWVSDRQEKVLERLEGQKGPFTSFICHLGNDRDRRQEWRRKNHCINSGKRGRNTAAQRGGTWGLKFKADFINNWTLEAGFKSQVKEWDWHCSVVKY